MLDFFFFFFSGREKQVGREQRAGRGEDRIFWNIGCRRTHNTYNGVSAR